MEPQYEDADAGAREMDANGSDVQVDAVVVPLADVTPTDLGRAKYPRIAHALSRESADVSNRPSSDRVWRWTIVVQGTCRRPSTTAHDRWRDALFAATRFIETAKRIVRFEPSKVGATITHAPCEPVRDGLPGQHVLCLELRDTDPATVGRICERLEAEAWTIGRLSSTTLTFTPHSTNPSVLYESAPVTVPSSAVLATRLAAEINADAVRGTRAG